MDAVQETEDRWAPYRPTGTTLMLLLRAAAVDDGQGGPWLTLTRSYTPNPRVFMHHIVLREPDAYDTDRLTLCSGVELLGKFCSLTRSVPARITDPARMDVRALADWCVERVDAETWDRDPQRWLRQYQGPRAKDRRADEHADAMSRVRSFRWLLAEEWLR